MSYIITQESLDSLASCWADPGSSLSYLTPSEFARRYYEKNQVTEANQSVEKAGSLSL